MELKNEAFAPELPVLGAGLAAMLMAASVAAQQGPAFPIGGLRFRPGAGDDVAMADVNCTQYDESSSFTSWLDLGDPDALMGTQHVDMMRGVLRSNPNLDTFGWPSSHCVLEAADVNADGVVSADEFGSFYGCARTMREWRLSAMD